MSDESSTTAGPSDAALGTAPQVRALDYLELRELAEAAAGVENQAVDFFFPEGRILVRAQPGQELTETDVLVPVYNRGKFPRNRLRLSLSTEGGQEPPGVADAVFWSDAAVHKFLIPYAASFAGESAEYWVKLVQEVWNHYPADEVTVYALVHVTSTLTDVELDPALSLLVAFVVRGGTEVEYLTLPEFRDRFGYVHPPAPHHMDVAYRRGAGTVAPQLSDYAQLRAMAEWAASLRDKPSYFVFRPGEQGFEVLEILPLEPEPGEIVVPAFSPTVPPGRPMLPGVLFKPEGIEVPTNVANDGDALFWSTGSIEQFIVPYYASKGGLKSLPDLATIAHVWETTGPGRRTRMHGDPIIVNGDPVLGAELSASVQVYGLIHLPTSQWTEVESGFTVTGVNPGSQMGMVSLTPSGGTQVNRPRHFRGPHR